MNNYKVYGMTCAVCRNSVEKAVSALPGVTSCNVSLLTNSMQVEGDATNEEIIQAVKDAGYKARLMEDASVVDSTKGQEGNAVIEGNAPLEDLSDDSYKATIASMIKKIIVSGVCLLILFFFSTGRRIFGYSLPEFLISNNIILYIVEMILSLIVLIINGNIFANGLKSIIHRAPNMDALVSLGAICSFIYSAAVSVQSLIFYGNMGEYVGESDIYFETAAMIVTLVSVGKLIEEMAKGKTTDAINGLVDLSPKTALLLTPNGEKEVPIEEVKVGDTFILKPGMRIPVDGIIKTGASAIDESSLTGESIPVDKEVGMTVSASTINMSGYLTCMATGVGDNTAFSKIVQMVKDAANGKVEIEKASDKVSTIGIPAVIVLALITFIVWMFTDMGVGFALSRAIAVLIISCPCAMGLATPIAIMAGNSVGARHGILYKTAESLENTGKTQIVVIDKTGTITTGQPKVTDIISTTNDMEHRDLLLKIAYSLESKSEHPLAKAICVYAEKRYVQPLKTRDFVSTPGKGIRANLLLNGKEHTIYAGNEAYISSSLLGTRGEDPFESDFTVEIKKLVDNGKTPIIFASASGLLGVIAVADEVEEEAKDTITAFHQEDIHVVMVTGDRYATAKAVAEEVGIASSEVLSEILPKDKADIVTNLRKSGKVAMIGDGVNDAPALTCADTGIAIGAGTDVAIDAADVVLIQNRLASAVDAIRISKSTLNIIQQNLFWALIYNIIGIPLAAGIFYRNFGWLLDPMFCALAMTASSIIVVLNALRLFKFKTTNIEAQIEENVEVAN